MREWKPEERSKAARQLLEQYRDHWDTYTREAQDDEVNRTASGRGAIALSFAVDHQCKINVLREALEDLLNLVEHHSNVRYGVPVDSARQALRDTAPDTEATHV